MLSYVRFVCCENVLSVVLAQLKTLTHKRFSQHATSGRSSFTGRSHTCGELQLSHSGEQVTLCGWLQYHRFGLFLVLRDWHGTTQVLIPEHKKCQVDNIPTESVLEVRGTVRARPDGQQNKKMRTGDIEVELDEVKVLNRCKPKLPFCVQDFHQVKEALRMEYRYLDFRNSMLQQNLRLRSEVVLKMREFLCKQHGFVDVETPTLFRSTPGGAKEFVVPSRHAGKFYSLPQSPQQFKQLLMVGGIDRYVQIARCYRDEGSKPDRQPEFTQVDIEMSFVDQNGILDLVEQMLVHCWPEDKAGLLCPFPRITYNDAMRKYGTDKPDARFDMQICEISDILRNSGVNIFEQILTTGTVQAINIKGGNHHLTNKDIENLQTIAKCLHSPGITVIKVRENGQLQSPVTKHLSTEVLSSLTTTLDAVSGDLILVSGGNQFEPHSILGKLRSECANLLEEKGVTVRKKNRYEFLWVVDFPLFLQKEGGGLESAHHPFTAPRPEDVHQLEAHPQLVRSQHYDLVLNGSEIGGGSIRIHDAEQQKYVIETILKEDVNDLKHILEALECGCPPHGGIALGLDRLMAIICGANSIRDVIAFPKSHDGKDPMSKAPAEVAQQDLDVYHIQVKDS